MKPSNEKKNLIVQNWGRLVIGITVLIALFSLFNILDRPFVINYQKFPWKTVENTFQDSMNIDQVDIGNNGPKITIHNAEYVTQLIRFGSGKPENSIWSPQGKYLLITSSIGVSVYDAHTFDKVHDFFVNSYIHSIAFSTDDSLLAVGGQGGEMYLWRMSDGGVHRVIEIENPHDQPMKVIGFSADHQYILGSLYNLWHIWRVGDGEHMIEFYPGEKPISELVFSTRAGVIVGLVSNHGYAIWDFATGDELERFDLSSRSWNEIIADYIDEDTKTSFLVPENGVNLPTPIRQVISADQRILVRVDEDRKIQVLSVSDGVANIDSVILNELDILGKWVESISISPDNSVICVVYSDNLVHVWKFLGDQLISIREYEYLSSSVDFSPEPPKDNYFADDPQMDYLASGLQDGGIQLYGVLDRKPFPTYDRKIKSVENFHVAFSPDGSLLASVYRNQICIWNLYNDPKLERCIDNSSYAPIPGLVYSPFGEVVIAAHEGYRGSSSDKEHYSVRMWGVKDGKMIREYKTGSQIISLAISPDGRIVAAGEREERITMWTNGYPTSLLTTDMPMSLAFSPDSSLLVAGLFDGSIQIWNPATKELVNRIELDMLPWSLDFSPDGDILALGVTDFNRGLILLYRVSDWKLLRSLEGHTGYITDLSFSPFGNLLASSSVDGTIRLWGVP